MPFGVDADLQSPQVLLLGMPWSDPADRGAGGATMHPQVCGLH